MEEPQAKRRHKADNPVKQELTERDGMTTVSDEETDTVQGKPRKAKTEPTEASDTHPR